MNKAMQLLAEENFEVVSNIIREHGNFSKSVNFQFIVELDNKDECIAFRSKVRSLDVYSNDDVFIYAKKATGYDLLIYRIMKLSVDNITEFEWALLQIANEFGGAEVSWLFEG